MATRSEGTENDISPFKGNIVKTGATLEYSIRSAPNVEGGLLRLENHRNSFKIQMSPISSLPNELLGTIFEYGYLSSPSLRMRPRVEVVLSHVNQLFRDVAMNTRLLWTRIKGFAFAYLQRSGTYPFDLYLEIEMAVGLFSDSQLRPDSHLYTLSEWETIISYVARCRTFSCDPMTQMLLTI